MPCLAYKNLTTSKDPVTCKGSVEEWETIKKETETLLKKAELHVVYNTQTFDSSIFDDDSMVKNSSETFTVIVNAELPTWQQMLVEQTDIDDETDLFNWGFGTKREFTQFQVHGTGQFSSWDEFPNKYKFTSLQINVKNTKKIILRGTKDVMQALGDFGGLLSIIQAIFSVLFKLISKNKVFSIITNRFYTWYEKEDDHE